MAVKVNPIFIIIAESYFVGARTCVCEVKTTWSGEGKILGGMEQFRDWALGGCERGEVVAGCWWGGAVLVIFSR